jgi:hypothetical protein
MIPGQSLSFPNRSSPPSLVGPSQSHVARPSGNLVNAQGFRLHGVQGKQHQLGMFADPVTAAVWYDREALKAYGIDAILNFPCGSFASLTSTGAACHLPVSPAGEECQEGPATNGLVPAGNAEGSSLPFPRPPVSLTSCFVRVTSSVPPV